MANPTTNYGWPMPTSTDLVTDLPADFALFGQPVDTSLKALNPETTLGDISFRSSTSNTNTRLGIGTAGQVLAVSGGVPAWTTTADVTPLTTKGDLFTFSTVDARLAVGTNGQVLTADSSEATGLKYVTPAAGALTVVKARTNFAAVANTSTTFESVFTSSYRNYQIIIDSVSGSNNAVFYLTYYYGSSAQSTAYYGGVLQVKFDATTANIGMSNANQVSLSTIYSDAVSTYYINVNTQAGSNTALPIVWTGYQSSSQAAVMGAASQAGGTSRVYDGFQLSASTGNINGNVTIYGVSS